MVLSLAGSAPALALNVTANPPVVDPSSPTVSLQATDNPTPPVTDAIVWYGKNGQYVGGGTCTPFPTGAGRCLQSSDYVPPGVHTYTAALVTGVPPTAAPTGGATVEVVNPGWRGNLNISVERSGPDDMYATFTVWADKPMPFYGMSAYGPSNTRLGIMSCDTFPQGADSCLRFSAMITPGFTGTYRAFVARDSPMYSLPVNDVRASVAITFQNGQAVGNTLDGVDWNAIAQRLGDVTDEEIMLILSAAPEATHVQPSTVSDQALAYGTARTAGLSKLDALKKAIFTTGVAGTTAYLWHIHDQFWPPATVPTTTPAPGPIDAVPVPSVIPPRGTAFEDYLAEEYLRFGRVSGSGTAARRAWVLSARQARTAANQCAETVGKAITQQILPATVNGKHPCDPASGIRIFFPSAGEPYPAGRPGTAVLATQHDFNALKGHPTWVRQAYVNQTDKESRGVDHRWYIGQCTAAPDEQCHEFPYYATNLGGPGGAVTPVPKDDNQGHGQGWARFVKNTTCPLTSGGLAPTTPAQETGTPFLVIPLPQVTDFPSFFTCDNARPNVPWSALLP